MDIILLQRIEKLGTIGDVVTVKDGYARNFLLPQKKALRANAANKKVFEANRERLEKENAERRAEAEKAGEKVDGVEVVLIRAASNAGQLYGSVTARDIADAAEEAGYSVPRSGVRLDKPIKEIGMYDVSVRLHAEVTVTVQANVARSQDEADRQAKGEDIVASLQAANQALDDEQAGELAEAAAERAAEGPAEEE